MARQSKSNRAMGYYTPGYRAKWADPTWANRLTRLEKSLWTQLTEQPTITHAGTCQVDCEALAEQHPDATADEIERDLAGLVAKGYVRREGQWIFIADWFKINRLTTNINHLAPILRAIDGIGRKNLRTGVTEDLFAHFAQHVSAGETFSPAIIDALKTHSGKWDIPLPTKLLRPIRPVSSRGGGRQRSSS